MNENEYSLIANSGLQFITTEVDFNPQEPVMVNDTPLTLCFAEYPSGEPNVNRFELAYQHKTNYYLYSELRSQRCIVQKMNAYGVEHDDLAVTGVPKVDQSKVNPENLWQLNKCQCYTEFNAEGAFRLLDEDGTIHTPWERILGKWLPAPMFYVDDNQDTKNFYPAAWCRMRIDEVSKGKNNINHYRLVWAFDTTLAEDPEDVNLPDFPQNVHSLSFGISTKAGQYLSYLQENTWVGEYLSSLIFGEGVMPAYKVNDFLQRCRHLGFYISLFTQLRSIPNACPKIKLYNRDLDPIEMDLVLDIGNSRTCGILCEGNDLTTSTMLSLRDIENPYKVYQGSFDMRLAFHRAEFGENNMGLSNVFRYRSFVRIGEEARYLISREQRAVGVSARLTHHSSPKRYLWDAKPYRGKWEFLLTDSEPALPQRDAVYVKRLSEQFKVDGNFRTRDDTEGQMIEEGSSFSRRSLMTMVMIEILQQAIMQVNSYDYLNVEKGRGNIDRAREIRNIIITCPTAMSKKEQVELRQCAHDAFIAIQRSLSPDVLYSTYDPAEWEGKVHVVPSEADLTITKQAMFGQKVEWGFDEATCSQMVYVYSEIVDRYRGNCQQVIESKGHVRPELKASGYDRKSLTIGSVDIGAGTTDLMICSYKYDQYGDRSILTPIPLFWDSFYIAGDDLLQEIVMRVVLKENNWTEPRPGEGSMYNAIVCSLLGKKNIAPDSDEMMLVKERAHAQLIGFFSKNAPAMSELDRVMRNDFNVQISVPIAQKMMDMMKNMDVARSLSYDEIFGQTKPSKALLEYVETHFGFKVQDLTWSYSPDVITECIRCRIEPLIKQLSIILNTFQCDVVLLAGRPTSLVAITDMFLKYFPVSPDRLIRMLPKNDNFLSDEKKWNCYKVGRWFPTSDSLGYFKDLKPVVAMGALVAYKAEHGNLPNFQLEMKEMINRMDSTANILGTYNASLQRIVRKDILLAENTSITFTVSLAGLPYYIGCKQINTDYYQARPLYALRVKEGADLAGYDLSSVRITITRIPSQDKEQLFLQSALDKNNQSVADILELEIQSLVLDINSQNGEQASYWLDNGAFNLN